MLAVIIASAFMFRLFRELEDEIARGNHKNWAFWPNSDNGWTAKWKYPLEAYLPKWYHFGVHTKHEERYPYSSTLLVWTTDAEHFYQFIQTVSIVTMLIVSAIVGCWWKVLIAVLVGFIVAQILKEIIKTID